ncbi:sugar kinase [Vibrio sinaloensis]|uniref:sugar kinase n=1 Tax=Photobacterium sp. (strain ATCC 43367) TaxID=379097 RepID=UPI00058069D3|nr:sugar kinase [Vibrio sinaloensis]KHT44050.1 ketodeoxygluconokinase [Vibrio sinaloensis]
MNPIKRVAVIGECMVELKKIDGSVQQSFGGDTLNTAVYLSRLTHAHGVNTSYVTGLGKDPFSKEMIEAWQEEHINTELVYRSETKLPGIYAIETDESGERSFYYWRNDSAAKYWLRERALLSFAKDLCAHQMVYLSGISLAILAPDCRQSLINLLALCRRDGVKIVFDNNFRPALWESKEQARALYKEILSITDIAFLTFEDEQALYGDEQELEAIERTQALGVEEIVIKRGGEACYIVTSEGWNTVAPQEVEQIIDTTAAGDSFSAGYLAKRILGGTSTEAAEAGHAVAGTVIQHRGAIIANKLMPTI